MDEEELDESNNYERVKQEIHDPELPTGRLASRDGPNGDREQNLFEFNEVKEETFDSDAEEDLPLLVLKNIASNGEVARAPVCSTNSTISLESETKAFEIESEKCKPESVNDKVETLSSDKLSDCDENKKMCQLPSDTDSFDEMSLAKKRKLARMKRREETVEQKLEGSNRRRTRAFRVEEDSKNEASGDDEEDRFEQNNFDSNCSQDEFVFQKDNERKRRSTKVQKRKRGPRKKLMEKMKSTPTLHDYRCYICNSDSLGSRKAMIEHFSVHVDKVPYTCRECVMETVVLTRVRTLNTHMKMHAQPVKCDYCDRRYSNAAGKYYHTQTFHLGGGAPCLVNCEVCGKTCGSQMALKQHMKYHTTKLKCSKCDMVFNHPNKRRNHERTHDENRGYECVVCKKVLQTIESYDVHLKKHSQERSYQCHLCPKKFNTSCNLILHLKVHAKNDNYKPAKSWIEHYTVLSRNPMHFKCKHCDRYNTDKVNNMISHLQAHFKEYECDQCHHKFATAKQLRAHYTTHTGEKPEKCKYCEKVFSTKNNLRIHLKATHPEWAPRRQQQQTPTQHDDVIIPGSVQSSTAAGSPPQPINTPNDESFESSTVGSTYGIMRDAQVTVLQQPPAEHQLHTLGVLRS
ncbi:zinc finger protein 37-like [Toxorhynchites rutilus septentrionalis]|uniref:zinc finger protein 37-like n=1 Tax=Toxorhynchites rutilus septentrionalis TaxID=329112 RepID=UPI00247A3B16|nr:zinc finger protein 37-like [Toxorhynchites rutilus septentrionalis]